MQEVRIIHFMLGASNNVPQGVDGNRWHDCQQVQTNFMVIRLFLYDAIDGIMEDRNLIVNVTVHFLFAEAKVAQVAKSKAPLGLPQITLSDENTCNICVLIYLQLINIEDSL
jgi:hypothetical protein